MCQILPHRSLSLKDRSTPSKDPREHMSILSTMVTSLTLVTMYAIISLVQRLSLYISAKDQRPPV